MSALDRVLSALRDTGHHPQSVGGGQYKAQCPAHDDRSPSLSIRGAADKVLLHCLAGCATGDVAAALGLGMADLFDEKTHRGRPVVVAEYAYTDDHGEVLFVKERRAPKDFRVKRPDGRGGWTWKGIFSGPGAPRRVLYRLPEVLAAVKAGQPVFVVEGEKDADNLAARGMVATCNYEGAAKEGQRPKWRPEYGDQLRGAHVFVIADRDEPGRAHARAIVADLSGKAASVHAFQAAVEQDKADVTDHLNAGYGLDQLIPLDLDQAPPAPRASAPAAGLADQLDAVLTAIRGYRDDHGDLGLHERPHKLYGAEHRFRCPVHADERLSVVSAAVALTKTKVSVYCNRKCGSAAILAALGVPDALAAPEQATVPGVDEGDPRPRIDVTDEVTAVEGTVTVICERLIPDTYIRTGNLVVISETSAKVSVHEVGEDRLRALLTEHTVTYRDTPRGKVRALPSVATCRAILARSHWPGVPELAGIVYTPVLRPDGTVLQDPGYDPATRLFLHRRVDVPAVPAEPSRADVAAALELLADRMLRDFPWIAPADKANYLAALLTPILRPYIGGLAPLVVITAPERGSGKTLLADLIRHVFGADMRAWPEHDAEMRKSITAALRETQPAIVFDNIPARAVLDYPALAMALTNPEWTDRVLGRSRQVSFPNDRLWIVTGTNVRLGGDFAQRSLLVRIDPGMPRPDLRSGFAIPDLDTWTQDHRGDILHALLTLARAWIVAGSPTVDVVMRGFTRWGRAVGGLLAFHGVEGFLGNRHEVETHDEDNEVWSAFLTAWKDKFGDKPMRVGDLLSGVDTFGFDDQWSAVVPRRADGGVPSAKTFGAMLRERNGRWYGGLALRGVHDTHSKTWKWGVIEFQAPPTPTPSPQGDHQPQETGTRGHDGTNGADLGSKPAGDAGDAGNSDLTLLTRNPPPSTEEKGEGGPHIGRATEDPHHPQHPQPGASTAQPTRPGWATFDDDDSGGTDDDPDPLYDQDDIGEWSA